jgi:hypothetical protein
MKKVLSLCVLISSPILGNEPEMIQASPFAHSKEYEQPDWPNIEIPSFVIGIAGFWVENGKWPKSIEQVKEGLTIWAKSVDQAVLEHPEQLAAFDLAERFQIKKVIPMWHGAAYKIVYTTKKGVSVKGLIFLDEGDSVEEIVKLARYSRDLGGIVHAVPF